MGSADDAADDAKGSGSTDGAGDAGSSTFALLIDNDLSKAIDANMDFGKRAQA